MNPIRALNPIPALNRRLVDDWRRTALKLRSIQLAAVAAVITGVLVANPVIVVGLIALLPTGPLLYLVAAVVALFVFVIPAVTRLWAQPSPPSPPLASPPPACPPLACPEDKSDADQPR